MLEPDVVYWRTRFAIYSSSCDMRTNASNPLAVVSLLPYIFRFPNSKQT